MTYRKPFAALAAAVFLLASDALAHGGDASLLHACVKQGKGDVRIVSPTDRCKRNESSLHWPSQAGTGSGGVRGVQLFPSDGSFTVPPGVTSVLVEVWGGGGAAGLASGPSQVIAGGGGGGGYLRTEVTVIPGQVVPVTVGHGGIAQCGMDGGAGGNTSFGGAASAGGGQGGTVAGQGGVGGAADPGGISSAGEAGRTFPQPGGNDGQSAQGSFASPGRNPGRGGFSSLAPGTQSCSATEMQFATGQPGQLIVQW